MNKVYNFELNDGRVYDTTNDKVLLLHPFLLRENTNKLAAIHSNVITFYSKESEGLIIARNLLDKFGVFDAKGNMIVDFIYDKIEIYINGLAGFKQNNKWGFINREGNVVIEPIYDMVYSFNEGYAKVFKNGYYGLIRKDGKLAVECNLINVGNVVNGVAKLKHHNYIKINEPGAFIMEGGINFFGSPYYHKNRNAELEQRRNFVVETVPNTSKNSKINLFDLIDNGEQEIENYKLDMQMVKSITDKFNEIQLAYDLENKTLIAVTHWEEKKLEEHNINEKAKKMF